MPGRIESTFGLYNFFSKSIPGLVLLAGLLLVAPASWLDALPRDVGFKYVLSLAVAILTGFVVGQVVHSLSSSTEKGYLSLRETATTAVDQVSPLYARVPDWLRRLLRVVSYPVVRLVTVVDGQLTSSFTKQRTVFERTMGRFEAERDSNVASRILLDRCDEILNGGDELQGGYSDLYLVLVSHLESNGGRAKEFQSLYSFTRSMWFVLFVLSGVYLLFGFGVFGVRATVLVAVFETGLSFVVAAILSFVSGAVFLQDAEKYKSLYAEYLLADFHTSTSGSSE